MYLIHWDPLYFLVYLKISKYSQKFWEFSHKTTSALANFVIIVFWPVSQTPSQLFCSLCFCVADQRKGMATFATFHTVSRMKKKEGSTNHKYISLMLYNIIKNPAYGRHQLSRPMRIVGPIQFWRSCVIFFLLFGGSKIYFLVGSFFLWGGPKLFL